MRTLRSVFPEQARHLLLPLLKDPEFIARCDRVRPGGTTPEQQAADTAHYREKALRNWERREGVRTHCRAGHPWVAENIITLRNGRRRCRACKLARVREWKARRSNAAGAERIAAEGRER